MRLRQKKRRPTVRGRVEAATHHMVTAHWLARRLTRVWRTTRPRKRRRGLITRQHG